MRSALSVLEVAKKDLGEDQAGQENCSSKGLEQLTAEVDALSNG